MVHFKRWFELWDVNEDGALDIVMLGSTQACVYPGTGTGAFGKCSAFVVSNGSTRDVLLLADTNEDEHLDAISVGHGDFEVRLGHGDGSFEENAEFRTSISTDVTALEMGDFNEDGHDDLVVLTSSSTSSTATVEIHLGAGNGSFERDGRVFVSGWAQAVDVGDVNNDGHLDVLVANADANALIVVLGSGDGQLDGGSFSYPAGERSLDLAVVDMNNDGWLDVAAPGYDSGTAGVLFGAPPLCPAQ